MKINDNRILIKTDTENKTTTKKIPTIKIKKDLINLIITIREIENIIILDNYVQEVEVDQKIITIRKIDIHHTTRENFIIIIKISMIIKVTTDIIEIINIKSKITTSTLINFNNHIKTIIISTKLKPPILLFHIITNPKETILIKEKQNMKIQK